MLLFEVMHGLPNAYLDGANAQRVVRTGTLPATYWWCLCPEAVAIVSWPCPQPQCSSLLAPVLLPMGRCLCK